MDAPPKEWRKRVGVEPTIRPAKDRIAGFEGREGHRTPFASTGIIEATCGGFQSFATALPSRAPTNSNTSGLVHTS